MNINLDFWKRDIIFDYYSKFDNELKKIVESSSDIDFDLAFLTDTSSTVTHELSNIRKNILEWYDFNKTSSVLEINMQNGIITDLLCRKFDKVKSVAFSKKHVETIASKLNKYDNLEIIVSSLDDIKFSEKFDYITFIGGIENLNKIYSGNFRDLLILLKGLINEDGHILIAVDNAMSCKRIVGGVDNYSLVPFEKITGITRKKIIDDSQGILNSSIYYPLPDYKITNVIFSDRFLPTENNNKLMYNMVYTDGSSIVSNELEYVKKMASEGVFPVFANSFFVDFSNCDNSVLLSEPRFVSYNNIRKEKYRLITKLYDSYVKKIPMSCESEEHIKNMHMYLDELNSLGFKILDSYDGNNIISKYCEHKSFNRILIEKIISRDQDEFFELISIWNNDLLSKLKLNDDILDIKENNVFNKSNIFISDDLFKKLHFTKFGYFDLVFENAFFIDGQFYLYDQEWKMDNLPIEFILYRAINNIYIYSSKLDQILPKINVYEKFNLTEYISIFEELEKVIQDSVVDCSRLILYNNSYYKYRTSIDIVKKKYDEFLELLGESNAKCEEAYRKMNELKTKIEEKDNELNNIKNSRTYKFAQKLRKIIRK